MPSHELNEASHEVIGAIEIHIASLAEMDGSEQINFMRKWFLANYEDPVHSLPYESREGGYIWIDGGPYNAHEELHSKFHEFVPEAVIEALAEELSAECFEWAAKSEPSDDDVHGFDSAAEPVEYIEEFQQAMKSNHALLAIEVPDSAASKFYGMVFVNLITIMETYLSDAFIGMVPQSQKFMRKFVATTPEFKKTKLSLTEIYDSMDKISETAEEHLKNVVWHNLAKVQNMYRDTLGVTFPENLSNIFRAIKVRHALVHRNGKIEGEYVRITKGSVQKLAEEIDKFICSISKQIGQVYDEEIQF